MSNNIKTVALLGASGVLGAPIYAALLVANFDVTVISRPESTTTYPSSAKVTTTAYTLEALTEVFRNHDAVVSALAIPACAIQTTIIDAAIAAGVKRFIPSYFAYAVEKEGLKEMAPFKASKMAILKYVEENARENEGFTYSSVACGAVLDLGFTKFPLLSGDIPGRSMRVFDSGNELFTGTALASIAQAVVGTLQNPGPTANQHLKVRSTQSSQNEIVAALEKVYGEKWNITRLDSKEVLEDSRAKLAKGDRSGMLNLLGVQLFADGDGKGFVASEEECDNALVGVKEQSIESVIREVLFPE